MTPKKLEQLETLLKEFNKTHIKPLDSTHDETITDMFLLIKAAKKGKL